jgi:hypothetical protein
MSGYVKAEGVVDTAGLWLRADGPNAGQMTAWSVLDNMYERPIKGTSGWARYELVMDVPTDAAIILFGAHLAGPGQLWVDDLKFDIVDASVPTTGGEVRPVDPHVRTLQPRSRQPQNLGFED